MRALPLLAAILLAAAPRQEARELPGFLGPLEPPPVPEDNPMSDAKVALGRMLFHDPDSNSLGEVTCRLKRSKSLPRR